MSIQKVIKLPTIIDAKRPVGEEYGDFFKNKPLLLRHVSKKLHVPVPRIKLFKDLKVEIMAVTTCVNRLKDIEINMSLYQIYTPGPKRNTRHLRGDSPRLPKGSKQMSEGLLYRPSLKLLKGSNITCIRPDQGTQSDLQVSNNTLLGHSWSNCPEEHYEVETKYIFTAAESLIFQSNISKDLYELTQDLLELVKGDYPKDSHFNIISLLEHPNLPGTRIKDTNLQRKANIDFYNTMKVKDVSKNTGPPIKTGEDLAKYFGTIELIPTLMVNSLKIYTRPAESPSNRYTVRITYFMSSAIVTNKTPIVIDEVYYGFKESDGIY